MIKIFGVGRGKRAEDSLGWPWAALSPEIHRGVQKQLSCQESKDDDAEVARPNPAFPSPSTHLGVQHCLWNPWESGASDPLMLGTKAPAAKKKQPGEIRMQKDVASLCRSHATPIATMLCRSWTRWSCLRSATLSFGLRPSTADTSKANEAAHLHRIAKPKAARSCQKLPKELPNTLTSLLRGSV